MGKIKVLLGKTKIWLQGNGGQNRTSGQNENLHSAYNVTFYSKTANFHQKMSKFPPNFSNVLKNPLLRGKIGFTGTGQYWAKWNILNCWAIVFFSRQTSKIVWVIFLAKFEDLKFLPLLVKSEKLNRSAPIHFLSHTKTKTGF